MPFTCLIRNWVPDRQIDGKEGFSIPVLTDTRANPLRFALVL